MTLMTIADSLPFCFKHRYVPMHMTPFGFLYPLCGRADEKNCFFLRCLLAAMTLSLTIELLQPLINDARSADITDVITNTVGGMYLREVKEMGSSR